MKSIYHGKAAANCKMKGKHYKLLSCKCCTLINFKKILKVESGKREITEFLNKEMI